MDEHSKILQMLNDKFKADGPPVSDMFDLWLGLTDGLQDAINGISPLIIGNPQYSAGRNMARTIADSTKEYCELESKA